MQLEEALSLRMDFILFSGFDGAVPDATTLCRFRGTLTEQKKWKVIFKEINRQFIAQGIAVKPAQQAIVDATIIASAARPGCLIEMEPAQPEIIENNIQTVEMRSVRRSADPDARWTKKNKQFFYGYRGHIITDDEAGFIAEVSVTPANKSEVTHLDEALGELRPKRLLSDKGYASKANRVLLKARGVKSGLMFKASSGKPLSHWQNRFNSIVSRTRFRVEQAFGTLKRRFKFTRSRYLTRLKVEAEFVLKAIVFNSLKAVHVLRRASPCLNA